MVPVLRGYDDVPWSAHLGVQGRWPCALHVGGLDRAGPWKTPPRARLGVSRLQIVNVFADARMRAHGHGQYRRSSGLEDGCDSWASFKILSRSSRCSSGRRRFWARMLFHKDVVGFPRPPRGSVGHRQQTVEVPIDGGREESSASGAEPSWPRSPAHPDVAGSSESIRASPADCGRAPIDASER